MNEINRRAETLFPPGSFADTLSQLPPLELRSALREFYPAIDLPSRAIMIGDPTESLELCPRAFHVTTTAVLDDTIDIRPLSYHRMNFEAVTGKVMIAVVDAFNGSKFRLRSVNDPYPIPTTGEVSGGVFLGNNVSEELLRMSREDTFARAENIQELSYSLALLAWQVRTNSPAMNSNQKDNDKILLPDYVAKYVPNFNERTFDAFLKKMLSEGHDSTDSTYFALRKLGVTGFWSKSINSMIRHPDQYPSNFQINEQTEEELIRLCQNMGKYKGSSQHSSRSPIILEVDPQNSLPVINVNNYSIPYTFYTDSRPDSVLTIPQLKGNAVKSIWIAPEDIQKFLGYLSVRQANPLARKPPIIRRPVATHSGRQPIFEVIHETNEGNIIPVFEMHDGDIPTIDLCIGRYSTDEKGMLINTLKKLKTGKRMFITDDKWGDRARAFNAFSSAVGVSLSKEELELISHGIMTPPVRYT